MCVREAGDGVDNKTALFLKRPPLHSAELMTERERENPLEAEISSDRERRGKENENSLFPRKANLGIKS